ncbi:MAG TPA: hypothetical protein VK756_08850 [Solirubrobacteraceae bacterium]|jgi:hypothetical protein|nr:hypothetical protein [Solirubrobacteraceae bacterium]
MAIAIRSSAQRLRDRARGSQRLDRLAQALTGAVALEPGGPSSVFGADELLPVYPQLAALESARSRSGGA